MTPEDEDRVRELVEERLQLLTFKNLKPNVKRMIEDELEPMVKKMVDEHLSVVTEKVLSDLDEI